MASSQILTIASVTGSVPTCCHFTIAVQMVRLSKQNDHFERTCAEYECFIADTLFHEVLHVCDYPYHVDCGDRPKPGETTTTRKPTTSTTTQTTTTSSDMCEEFMTASCPLTEDNLVGDLVTEDAANCQEYCSQSPECEWFTWYKPMLRCYLLASCDPPEECECCVR